MSDDTTPFIVVPLNPLVNEGFPDRLIEEKKLIRERILNATNKDIAEQSDLMDEICALGSDLNINAFACNFRMNGEVNDDVEEGENVGYRILRSTNTSMLSQLP
jgi:hypothetical protein